MRFHLLQVAALAGFLAVSPADAQTLSARPAIFSDPALGADPRSGELVLGQTTLAGALRIFAVELEDSVRLPLRRPSNPDTLWPAAGRPSGAPKAHHRLDLGAGRYVLYFDKNERLVSVQADRMRLPRGLRREDLVAHYPTLRLQYRARSVMDWLVAPLDPCVSATATVWEGEDGLGDSRHLLPGTVVEFGYSYSCATKPAPIKANLQ